MSHVCEKKKKSSRYEKYKKETQLYVVILELLFLDFPLLETVMT